MRLRQPDPLAKVLDPVESLLASGQVDFGWYRGLQAAFTSFGLNKIFILFNRRYTRKGASLRPPPAIVRLRPAMRLRPDGPCAACCHPWPVGPWSGDAVANKIPILPIQVCKPGYTVSANLLVKIYIYSNLYFYSFVVSCFSRSSKAASCQLQTETRQSAKYTF